MKNDIALEITIPNQTRFLSLIGKIGENIAREIDNFTGDKSELAGHLNIVLTEALVNTIKHANEADPAKEVLLKIKINKSEICIQIYDNGKGFDLESIPNPCFEANAIDDKGRGIFIIRSLMDSVEYKNDIGVNVLEIKKRIS